MKILITGTHFTPALAVINEFKKYNDSKVVYVGRKNTMEGDSSPSVESRVIPEAGAKFISLVSGRVQRSFTAYTIPALLKIPVGFIHAFMILLKEKPDVVLSFGGYISVPVVFCAWLLSIPIIVHQQTLVEGLANRITNLFADKVALSFKTKKLNGKYILTGNPLRQEVVNFDKTNKTEFDDIIKTAKKRKLPLIVVTGGNQGSHLINRTVEEILDRLLQKACVIHVTGENKFNDYQRLEKLQSENYFVKKWINKGWGKVLSEADLVITRAGINTLMEIAFFGKNAIVVPIPYLSGNEQQKNGDFFKELGIAYVLPQSLLSGKSLLREVENFLDKSTSTKKVVSGLEDIVIVDAPKRLALETVLLINR